MASRRWVWSAARCRLGGGEDPPGVEQRLLPSSGMPHVSRPPICSAFLCEVNAVNGTSATCALEIQVAGGLVVDRVGCT